MAPEDDDHGWSPLPDDGHAAGEAPQQPDHRAHVGEGEPALDAPAGQLVETEAGGGHHGRFHAAVAAHEVDGGRLVAPVDQRLGGGQPGQEVAGGAAPGHDRPGVRGPHHRRPAGTGRDRG